jgi:hypothetical protein
VELRYVSAFPFVNLKWAAVGKAQCVVQANRGGALFKLPLEVERFFRGLKILLRKDTQVQENKVFMIRA